MRFKRGPLQKFLLPHTVRLAATEPQTLPTPSASAASFRVGCTQCARQVRRRPSASPGSPSHEPIAHRPITSSISKESGLGFATTMASWTVFFTTFQGTSVRIPSSTAALVRAAIVVILRAAPTSLARSLRLRGLPFLCVILNLMLCSAGEAQISNAAVA